MAITCGPDIALVFSALPAGLCWDAWLECMAQEHEQDLASFLTEVCPVFHAQAQRLAESPWLLTKRL
eukprot:1141914-Pelagomonas_calceolata.AAC.4